MAVKKMFAGRRVRRLRRANALTQVAMAEMLDISTSYLNLIERDQRPLTAALMLRLAELFDFDPRTLAADEPGGGGDAVRRRLADPLFADIEIDRAEVEEWLAAAPGAVEAFARAFDRLRSGGEAAGDAPDPLRAVQREIERWRNHFADLEARAEALADELRLGTGDLYGAVAERLRVRHQLAIRILPVEVMPDHLRRLDLHARQLQLSELLDQPSRTFQAAVQLGLAEARTEIDALVAGAAFGDRVAERLFRRHLAANFAAGLVMPYGRFLRACEATGYDLGLLQRRFDAGFEMVAHRLTTLQRVGARGLPFFLLRVDRAGQISKRLAGASGSPLVDGGGACPLWNLHRAFDRPTDLLPQTVALEDGSRWFTLAQMVRPRGNVAGGVRPEYAIALGIAADLAGQLAHARGRDPVGGAAMPIGPGCARCLRTACPQRAAPPAGRALVVHDRERMTTPFPFVGD